jgi:hypothetical protein
MEAEEVEAEVEVVEDVGDPLEIHLDYSYPLRSFWFSKIINMISISICITYASDSPPSLSFTFVLWKLEL